MKVFRSLFKGICVQLIPSSRNVKCWCLYTFSLHIMSRFVIIFRFRLKWFNYRAVYGGLLVDYRFMNSQFWCFKGFYCWISNPETFYWFGRNFQHYWWPQFVKIVLKVDLGYRLLYRLTLYKGKKYVWGCS